MRSLFPHNPTAAPPSSNSPRFSGRPGLVSSAPPNVPSPARIRLLPAPLTCASLCFSSSTHGCSTRCCSILYASLLCPSPFPRAAPLPTCTPSRRAAIIRTRGSPHHSISRPHPTAT
mmetsp:Transcript_10263/g.17951  ORF Transcript_10263/g.17951 Transcript_10263/m.17951 type:complete len:117 (-) Transcript_10263:421-771(-)